MKNSLSEEIRMYTDQVPSAEEMAALMFPELTAGHNEAVKTRSIQFGVKKQPEEPVSIAMPINFDYDSADVRRDSESYLDEIGIMMNMEKLLDQSIVIEGHTDATGTDQYNLQLSVNRAYSVRDYLMKKHNISSDRLQIVGKGEMEILPGRNPEDPLNRRVQFYRAN